MNITPLDADQFTRGCFFLIVISLFLKCVTFTYIPWLVTCIQCVPAQTYANKLDHCWRLPPQLVVFLVSSTYNKMFSIRLSEAKENRRKIIESPRTFYVKLEAAEATFDSNADYVPET